MSGLRRIKTTIYTKLPLRNSNGDHEASDAPAAAALGWAGGPPTLRSALRLNATWPFHVEGGLGGESVIRNAFEQVLQRFGRNNYRSSERKVE